MKTKFGKRLLAETSKELDKLNAEMREEALDFSRLKAADFEHQQPNLVHSNYTEHKLNKFLKLEQDRDALQRRINLMIRIEGYLETN
jgi:hypothetical protein